MEWRDTDTLPDLGPTAMQQHPAYGRACAALGSTTARYIAGPANAPHGTAQVVIRRWPFFGRFALLARGPVWDAPVEPLRAETGTDALIRTLRRTHRGVIATAVAPRHRDPLSESGRLRIMTPGSLARLPLDGDRATRRARLAGKWRNRLCRAEEAPLKVSHAPLPEDGAHWLLTYEDHQSRKRGYKRLPISFTRAWRAVNGPRSTRLFAATLDGEPVAGMLFLLHGRSASYHIGWTGAAGRRHDAHTLLMWRASDWLAERGYAWADLGTLDTVSTPGLARFKLGTGAEVLPLAATWLDAPGTGAVARLFGQAGTAAGRRAALGEHPASQTPAS